MKKESKLTSWAIVVILLALLINNVYTTVVAHQDRQVRLVQSEIEYQARLVQSEQIQSRLDQHRLVVLTIFSDYQDAAYYSDLDRIAEQQLTATEYQMLLLQTLASQNILIIELLAAR